jgi:hypothetical protein
MASHDAQLRQAAFSHANRLAVLRGGVLDSAALAGGFEFGGKRIPLINPQRGIFKPRQMAHLLSIKTVFPRRGARVWYDDQREAHRQIYAGDDVVGLPIHGHRPELARQSLAPGCDEAADPGHLFPRHVARSVSADHSDVHRGMAPRAVTSRSRIRSDRRSFGSSCPPSLSRAPLRTARDQSEVCTKHRFEMPS